LGHARQATTISHAHWDISRSSLGGGQQRLLGCGGFVEWSMARLGSAHSMSPPAAIARKVGNRHVEAFGLLASVWSAEIWAGCARPPLTSNWSSAAVRAQLVDDSRLCRLWVGCTGTRRLATALTSSALGDPDGGADTATRRHDGWRRRRINIELGAMTRDWSRPSVLCHGEGAGRPWIQSGILTTVRGCPPASGPLRTILRLTHTPSPWPGRRDSDERGGQRPGAVTHLSGSGPVRRGPRPRRTAPVLARDHLPRGGGPGP